MGSRRGHNEGSIYKDGAKWIAAIDLGRDPVTGKRRRRRRSADTQAAARRLLRDLQRELAENGPSALLDRVPTVASYIRDVWLPHLEARGARGELRPATLTSYRQLVTGYVVPVLGEVRMRDLKAVHVEALTDHVLSLGRSAATANRTVAVLGKVCADARRGGLAAPVVADLAHRLPERVVDPPMPTDQHKAALLGLADLHPQGVAFVIAGVAGLRVGELCGLAWSDVDLDAGTLTVRRQARRVGGECVFPEPKSRAGRRTITIPGVLVDVLRAHRTRQATARLAAPVWIDPPVGPLVVTSILGTPADPAHLRRTWLALREQTGLPAWRIHDLRHVAASIMLTAGATVAEAAEALGHSDGGSLLLRRYSHVFDERRQVVAQRLDAAWRAGQ